MAPVVPTAVSLEAIPFSGMARRGVAGARLTSACCHGPETRCLECGVKEATGAVKCGYTPECGVMPICGVDLVLTPVWRRRVRAVDGRCRSLNPQLTA